MMNVPRGCYEAFFWCYECVLITWFVPRRTANAFKTADVTVVFCSQRMLFKGTFFSLPWTEVSSDENIVKAQVTDNVMFCYCPVQSCPYL